MNSGLYPNPRAHLFVSQEYDLAAGLIAEVPHGLGGKPQLVRWVLVNRTTDNGHAPGKELDAAFFAISDNNNQAFVGGADDVNVAFTMNASGTLFSLTRANGTEAVFTASRWKAKCYAWYWGA